MRVLVQIMEGGGLSECANRGKKIEEEAGSFNFADLPERCKAKVMQFLAPKNLMALAATSRECNAIAKSDFVWGALIPPEVSTLLSRATVPLSSTAMSLSKRKLFFDLTLPTYIDDGNVMFWVDRDLGKLCFMLSARKLQYASRHRRWLNRDRRHVSINWVCENDSSFANSAQIHDGCFAINGEFECGVLSPETEYTVSLKIKAPNIDFENLFSVNQHQNRLQNGISFRKSEKGWIECDIGRFHTRCGSNRGKIAFSVKGNIQRMLEDYWDVVAIDGVKIWPTSVVSRLQAFRVMKSNLIFSYTHL